MTQGPDDDLVAEMVLRFVERKQNVVTIAAELHVSVATVYRWPDKAGVQFRPYRRAPVDGGST